MINIMKKLFLIVVGVAMTLSLSAAPNGKKMPELDYVKATELSLLGKLCKTTNPYHRLDVDKYPDFTKNEANLLKMSSGLMVAFKTNSKSVYVKAQYGLASSWNSYAPLASTTGFSLLIKDAEGEWTWAGAKAHKMAPVKENFEKLAEPLAVVVGMNDDDKECLLYLPLYAELLDLEIGVDKGAKIEALPNPFRHKIGVFGSSFTHGSCASGTALTWPAFLSRSTGLYLCSWGMSGNSKLQPYIGDLLGEAKCDAYICDAFSNPSVKQIEERIRPFVKAIRKHTDAPIIFLNTIYREHRNFRPAYNKREQDRIDCVERVLAEVTGEFKSVYFVNVPNQTGTDHITSADGTHPYSYGYHRWAQAIEKPILKILKKHKIK